MPLALCCEIASSTAAYVKYKYWVTVLAKWPALKPFQHSSDFLRYCQALRVGRNVVVAMKTSNFQALAIMREDVCLFSNNITSWVTRPYHFISSISKTKNTTLYIPRKTLIMKFAWILWWWWWARVPRLWHGKQWDTEEFKGANQLSSSF
jgi:hypothetical protein